MLSENLGCPNTKGKYSIITIFLTLSQTTNFRLFQIEKRFQTTILILMKMAESSPKEKKTLWEKEKLLVMSNVSFSHSVFKRLVPQTCKNKGLFGKGLSGTVRHYFK